MERTGFAATDVKPTPPVGRPQHALMRIVFFSAFGWPELIEPGLERLGLAPDGHPSIILNEA